jgi:hypothetical protein
MVKADRRKRYRVAALILLVCVWARTASAPATSAATIAPTGRIYIFRMVRSFGAHLDDYVTVNGNSVARVSPGNGIYCDVAPGDYIIGVARHKTQPLRVSVTSGHEQYVCVMLHQPDGTALRKGAPTSDQSFDLRLLEPGYGAERIQQYHLAQANCQP